jgi:cysteine sulfinate desulfinase/cysteine desulfurase-like protein
MGAVRLSVGRYTTEAQVRHAAEALGVAWRALARRG